MPSSSSRGSVSGVGMRATSCFSNVNAGKPAPVPFFAFLRFFLPISSTL
jgi:hypothetical protein